MKVKVTFPYGFDERSEVYQIPDALYMEMMKDPCVKHNWFESIGHSNAIKVEPC